VIETRHRYRFNFGLLDSGVDLGSNCQGIISTSTTPTLHSRCIPYLTRHPRRYNLEEKEDST
jgi:hypothetical protein